MKDEESENYGLGTVVVGVMSVFVIWISTRVWQHFHMLKHFERMNVPHRRPLPIVGNMWPVVSKKMSITECIANIYKEFPESKYSGMFDFWVPIYVLRDPELIKTVTVKYFEHFANHSVAVDESIDSLIGGNIFMMTGERWKEMRSIVTPVFTASKMRGMFELIFKCAEDFQRHLLTLEQPLTLELKDAFTRYANDVIATTAFGVSVDSLAERENAFYTMGKKAINFDIWRTLKFLMFSCIPWIMKLLRQRMVPIDVVDFFSNLVKDTIETRKRRNITRSDLIHLLMNARHKDNKEKLSYDEITAQAFLFFFAGFENSSILMCFAAYLLAVHPEIQDRVIAEVDAAYEKSDGTLTYDDVNNLEYMEMVLKESLRMYPPAAITDRIVTREFELPPADEFSKPVLLKPGERVWIPMYGLHHDPRYFPEPEKFDPERFSPENEANVNPFAYLPFGVGPRICPGNRFTLLETKVLFCSLLRNFRLRTRDKTHVPLIPKKSINMSAKRIFWLTLEPRKSEI